MRDYLIWNEFGNIYQKTASYDEAIKAYSKAIQLAPNFGWPYQNLASAYLSKGLFSEAVPLLQKSIDLLQSNSEKAISFSRLGDAYRQLGDYQNALTAYQQADALSADPFDRHARTDLDETLLAVDLDPITPEEAAEFEPVAQSVELEVDADLESDSPVAIEEDLTPELVAENAEPDPVAESVALEVEAAPKSETHVDAEEAAAPNLVAESVAPEVDAVPVSDTPAPEEETVPEPIAESVEPEEDIDLEEDLAPVPVVESGEPEVNASIGSDPPIALEEDLTTKPVAESVEPEVDAAIEGELTPEPVAEITETGSIDHIDELSNDDNFDGSLAEKLDILAEAETEDAEPSQVLGWTPSSDSEPNEEDLIADSEPNVDKVIAPFDLGSPLSNSFKGNQQTDDFEPVTLLPANFDAPKGSKASSDNTVHSLGLDVEESELPKWLEEHISSSNSDDSSEFMLWQPLAQKEGDTSARERGFNFVELSDIPFTNAETPDQSGEPTPTSDLFSDFAPLPLQVSGEPEILENSMSEGAALVDQTVLEDEANVTQAIVDVEDPLPEAGPEAATEPVVTTNVLHSADSYELSQKSEEDLKQSVSIYKKITDINPTNDRAWHTLGELYKSLNEYGEARTAYEQAISLNPNREIYHYHLGLVYATQQKNAEASRAFQKVIILNPEHILAHCALAGSYRRLGLDDEALEHLSIVEPKIQTETEYNRACFHAISENADEALSLLKIALEKRQTSRDWVQRDPDLDNIRNDPRFMEIIMSQNTLENP